MWQMDTYESRNRRQKVATGAFLAGAGAAAYLNKNRLMEYALSGAEHMVARFGAEDAAQASFAVTRAASKMRWLTERGGIRNLAISQVAEQRMRNSLTSELGWAANEADLLFRGARDVEWWTARDIRANRQRLAGSIYSQLRDSRGAGGDALFADINRARDASDIRSLYSYVGRGKARQAFGRDAQGALLRGQVEQAQAQIERRFLTELQEASERARPRFGASQITISDYLSDANLRSRFDTRTARSLNDSISYIGRLTSRHADLGIASTDIAIEGLWKAQSGQVYDMRGLGQLANRWLEGARNNFQIPVIPYMRGFSPFSLFPWLSGKSNDFVSVLPYKGIGRQLGLADRIAGRDLSVALVGKSAVGMAFGEGIEQSSEVLAENVIGLNARGGFGRRILENFYVASRAYDAPRQPLTVKNILGLGQQDEASFFGKLSSVVGKYDPVSGSTYPTTVLSNIVAGKLDYEGVNALATFLRVNGAVSDNVVSQVFDSRIFKGTPLEELVYGLSDDKAVNKFFADATESKFTPLSNRLSNMLSEYRFSEGTLRYGYHPRQTRKLFNFNLFGDPDPRRGMDLMREATIEEMVLRSASRDDGAMMRRILEGNFSTSEKERAISFVSGSLLSEISNSQGYDKAAEVLTKSPIASRLQANAHYMADNFLSRLDAHIPIYDDPDMPGLFLIRDHESLIGQINKSLKEGRGVVGAVMDAAGSPAIRQYTSSWFNGIRDPANFTRSSVNMYFFEERINRALGEFGLGLGPGDLGSSFDILRGFALKRIAPAWAAYEAYNYLNYEGDELGLPTPDKLYANLKANVRLARARLLGSHHFAQLYPGLEKYIGSTTYEEEKEQLRCGYEPVRASRYWLFGSSSEFMGGKVRYYLPDSFQRAYSGWQSADNADYSSSAYWAHSLLPTPAYPLSPIAHFADPYWWERRHSMDGGDRPYVTSGPLFTPETPWGPALNATIGELIKPVKVLHPEYDPRTIEAHRSLISGDVNRAGSVLSGLDGLLEPQSDSEDSDALLDAAYAANAEDDASVFTVQRGAFARVLPAGGIELKGPVGVGGVGRGGRSGAGFGFGARSGKGSRSARGVRAQISAINAELKARGSGIRNLRLADARTDSVVGFDGRLDSVEYPSNIENMTESVREHMGLYGWLMEMVVGGRPTGLKMDDTSHGYGLASRIWDAGIGGIGGELSEIGRKFLPHRPRTVEWYNPVPNQFYGSWLPGDDQYLNFQRSDPYVTVENGLLRLPGSAYEKVHGVKLMQSRASSLGKSVDEIVLEMIHRKPPLDEEGERVTELGTDLHKTIQARWRRMGILRAAEVPLYDDRLGVSGHIDALLNINGREAIGEIKTMSNRRYHQNRLFDEHLDQLNAYLGTTGVHSGLLVYVNRDNPDEVRVAHVSYSAARQAKVEARLAKARSRVKQMVARGEISRADLYDDVTRFEILSDVAPYSDQWQIMKAQLAGSDQLSEAEHTRVQAAKKRASTVKKQVELRPHHFLGSDGLTDSTFTVDKFLDSNTILTREGEVVRLAGVRASNQRIEDYFAKHGASTFSKLGEYVGSNLDNWLAAALEQTRIFSSTKAEGIANFLARRLHRHDEQTPAERLYARFGIHRGSALHVRYSSDDSEMRGQDMFHSIRAVVIAGGTNVNNALLRMGIGVERENDWTAAGMQARFSRFEREKGSIWEWFAHLDTPINTKFLRVRSPYEEYVRSQVHGKSGGSWESPISSYVLPTIDAYVARNPIAAAVSMGLFASMFTPSQGAKLTVGAYGAAIGAALSLLRIGAENISGKPWIPSRVQKRRDLEDYYDKLKYLKFKGLYDYAAERAKKEEHTDVDELLSEVDAGGETRKRIRRRLESKKPALKAAGTQEAKEQLKIINDRIKKISGYEKMNKLGPWATQALMYRQQYTSTIQGFEGNDYKTLMRALPKYEREIVAGMISDSTPTEKRRFYRLLPDYEKRLLGQALGIEDKNLPQSKSLDDYFKTHTLPGADWRGWSPDVDLGMLKTRAVTGEHLDPMDFGLYPQTLAQAEAITSIVEVPTIRGRSSDIASTLKQILSASGLRGAKVDVQLVPDPNAVNDTVSVDIDVRHDRHVDLISALRNLH